MSDFAFNSLCVLILACAIAAVVLNAAERGRMIEACKKSGGQVIAEACVYTGGEKVKK